MIAIRHSYLISFLLLTACTPKPPMTDLPRGFTAPPPAEAPLPPEDTAPRVKVKTPAAPAVSTEELTTKTTTAKTKEAKTEEKKESKELALSKKDAPPKNNKQEKISSSPASKISSWEISGAMAARSKGKGWSASVHWLQQGASTYQIRLSGPLSSGTVLINRSGGVVTLHDGPKTVSSSNAESLLKQQTGVSLPVSSLYYWARGIPAPGSVQGEKRDAAGRLLILKQAGYTIEYQKYLSTSKAILPSSVILRGNGIYIKFIIKNWRV